MTTARAALCALLVSAGSASSQSASNGPTPTAPGTACATVPPDQTQSTCPPTTDAVASVPTSTLHTSRSYRLESEISSATQWLRRETMAPQTGDLRGPQGALARQLDQADIRVALARAQADTVAARSAAHAPALTPDSAARLLISEWRRSAIEAADSAHHAILLRISASYDSAQLSRLSPSDWGRVLVRLDRINEANQTTWAAITSEIDRMADSATVANGGAP